LRKEPSLAENFSLQLLGGIAFSRRNKFADALEVFEKAVLLAQNDNERAAVWLELNG
jgi:Flp pilus assembly protein TadD